MTRYHRDDIVSRAVEVLDGYGLADLSMRRLAAELGLQPSALYHHVTNKQSLLAAVADDILRRGAYGSLRSEGPWDDQVLERCRALRDAMLAYRDGAELVATVHAFGLGASDPYEQLVGALRSAGLDESVVRTAATTLLYFVLGHVGDEQTRLQADSAGAIDADRGTRRTDHASFELGLELVLDGVRRRLPAASR